MKEGDQGEDTKEENKKNTQNNKKNTGQKTKQTLHRQKTQDKKQTTIIWTIQIQTIFIKCQEKEH